MREINWNDQYEQDRFNLTSLERLDNYCDLDTTRPYEWKRHESIAGADGSVVAYHNVEYTIYDLKLLGKLRDRAIYTRYLDQEKANRPDIAKFVIHSPKPL